MLKIMAALAFVLAGALPAAAQCMLPLDSLFWEQCRQPQGVQPPATVPYSNPGQDDDDGVAAPPTQVAPRYIPRQIQPTIVQPQPRQYGVPVQQAALPVQRQSSNYFDPIDIAEPTTVGANTIVVNLAGRYLTLYGEEVTELRGRSLPASDGVVWRKGTRYSIGVGKDGFRAATLGEYTVGRKQVNPPWYPPNEMIGRDPRTHHLDRDPANGRLYKASGDPTNPLGTRAMYLIKPDGVDSLFRIHGTIEPWTIGTNVSSGCFRMMPKDVEMLYEQVRVGTKVMVKQS
ncbi:MAG: L,D-transpeptidase [Patescibacteria group bacterium]